jgi:hypothetical protein
LTFSWAGRPKNGEVEINKDAIRSSGRFFMDMAGLAVIMQS